MSTLATVRSQIADDLNRSDLTTQINTAINRAIAYYQKESFSFNETSGTFSTVASQESYSSSSDGVPSTIKEIFRVEIAIASNNNQLIIPRTFDYIRDTNRGAATGVPCDYAWYQSKIYLSPLPNAVKTVTVYFGKSYAALSADSDTNDFTVYAEDLIEARALWWLYQFTLKDNQKAAAMKNVELEALLALDEKSRLLVSSGKITPTAF